MKKITLWCTVLLVNSLNAHPFHFELKIIDDDYNHGSKPGWSRLGDVDRDGFIDVVAGGGNYIGWYKNPVWTKAPKWDKRIIGAAGCRLTRNTGPDRRRKGTGHACTVWTPPWRRKNPWRAAGRPPPKPTRSNAPASTTFLKGESDQWRQAERSHGVSSWLERQPCC